MQQNELHTVTIQITDSEINEVERILLPSGCIFNQERREFIKCMNSTDVIACPGSGKTTALLAKLLILTQKMPFPDKRGICVLTHTNVAINEIKRRAGITSDILFRYPNFFGTIQTFVNKFLAIPFYRNHFGKPVVSICNEQFRKRLEYYYSKAYDLTPWLKERGGIERLQSYWLRAKDFSVGESLDDPIKNLRIDTKVYKKIKYIRRSLLNEGVLTYNDSYSLAVHSLEELKIFNRLFQERFLFCFIDEMQDTEEHQLRVLDNTFADKSIIIQRLGDPNQGIFSTEVGENVWKPIGDPPLKFSDTQRYGDSITKILSSVRVDDNISLQPNKRKLSKSPHLLTFQDGEEEKVIPAFSKLLHDLGYMNCEKYTFKAIGWIAKDKRAEPALCIPSYFPDYKRILRASSPLYSNLLSYIVAPHSAKQELSVRFFFDSITMGVLQCLRIVNFKNPQTDRYMTVHSFWEWLRIEKPLVYKCFKEKISRWIYLLKNDQTTCAEVRNELSGFLQRYFSNTVSPEWKEFLNSDNISDLPCVSGHTKNENRLIAELNFPTIEIGTVHSVKGETHTATLYLETKFHQEDTKRLLPFLKGNRPDKELKKVLHQKNLKVAHVGFSRATDLIVYACKRSNISTMDETDLKENGWIIKPVSKLLCGR